MKKIKIAVEFRISAVIAILGFFIMTSGCFEQKNAKRSETDQYIDSISCSRNADINFAGAVFKAYTLEVAKKPEYHIKVSLEEKYVIGDMISPTTEAEDKSIFLNNILLPSTSDGDLYIYVIENGAVVYKTRYQLSG